MRMDEEGRIAYKLATGEDGGGILSREEHLQRQKANPDHIPGSYGGLGDQFIGVVANNERREGLGLKANAHHMPSANALPPKPQQTIRERITTITITFCRLAFS